MKRRILSIVLALALCLSLCPGAALAAEGDETLEPAVPPEGALAEVRLPGGATTYPTTEAEFRAVFEDNDTAGAETTVTLLDTVTLAGNAIQIWYGTFTLDLNGKNINFTGSSHFSVGYDYWDSSSGGNLTTCGSGTVQASSFAVLASDKGTVTLAGGTFSTEREDTISVQATEASTLNVIGPDVEIEGLYVAAAVQVSLTAGKYNKVVTGSAQKPLRDLLGDNCAYYRNGSPIALADLPVGEDSGLPTLPGPFTVGVCEHPGLKATPDEGGGTHSGSCAYCSYAAEAEPCSYGTEYQHDENSHWRICTVCGDKNKESHNWSLAWAPNENGSGMLNYDWCYRCDREQGHFTVTVTVPDGLTYGNTGSVKPSYTLSEEKEWDNVIWFLTEKEAPIEMEPDGTLPAGLPTGDYELMVEGRKGEGAEEVNVFRGLAEFTVAPAQLPDVFTLSETEFTYDTTAHTPAVTAEGLTEGTDFTVEYSDNTAVGTASVTLTGKGNYTGTVTKEFTIKQAAPTITNASAELFYGQKLSDITSITGTGIPGTWTWANPNEQPLSGMYSAAFTPSDAANYESVPDDSVKVIVNAAAPEITLSVLPDLQQAGKDVEITYTVKNAYDPNLEDVPEVTLSYKIGVGAEQTLEQGVTSFTIPEGTKPNTTITVYARTQFVSGKYASTSQSAKVGVTDKIPVTITGVTAPDKVYDGQPYSLTGTLSAGDYDKGFNRECHPQRQRQWNP